jgi:predicted DCC family thiol-disulfide oxidoreductase YuxK
MFINIIVAATDAQGPAGTQCVHLVLYDGVCGLCHRLVQFLLAHDRRAVFAFAWLQGSTGRAILKRLGRNPDELTSFYVLTDYGTQNARALTRSSAALFVAREIGWPWKAAALLRVFPTRLLDLAYDAVARSRYRFFGRYEQCLKPTAEDRSRFID